MNVQIIRGAELTNNIILNRQIMQELFGDVFVRLPLREYDSSWRGMTGYLDPMVRMDLDVGTGFATVDTVGRRIVVLPGAHGNVIYFDRFGDRTGPIVCNGFTRDLAPSWTDAGNGSSGYVVDNDQFAEPLLRLLPTLRLAAA